jgi:hypothetical protein
MYFAAGDSRLYTHVTRLNACAPASDYGQLRLANLLIYSSQFLHFTYQALKLLDKITVVRKLPKGGY